MTPKKRDLILRVLDDFPDNNLLHFVYHIDHYQYSEQILKWLIANHLTGRKLKIWKESQWSNSMMEPVRFIIAQINKEKVAECSILYGRDYA